MSSWGICMDCQGEVALHEEHFSEFGQEWVKFQGKCPNCGRWLTEYPKGYEEASIRAEEQERKDREAKEHFEKYKDMTFNEYMRASDEGAFRYPFWIARKGDKTAYALTEQEAFYVGSRLAGGNSDFEIWHGPDKIGDYRSPPSAGTVALDIEFYIPRWKGDEDGDRFQFYMTVPTIDVARELINRYKWEHYFKWSIHGGRYTEL